MNNKLKCPECGEEEHIIKNGFSNSTLTIGKQKYKCKSCGNNFLENEKPVLEIAPETKKSNEQITQEIKNPKYENFKLIYKNKFETPKESKKYGFTFDSWFEYYQKRGKIKNKKTI